MRKRPVAACVGTILAVLAAALTAAPATPPAPDATKLAWLEGRWTGEKDGVVTEERWTGPLGGALLGLHADVKGGRLVSWEFLRIAPANGALVYYASPNSAPPTPFTLVEAGDRRAVFENKAHDFPQRILYWLDEAGALHARIEGPRGGKTVGMEWTWRRAALRE
jgi:hypothetical protein